ncbi:MAG: heme ABC exporter ATP-binding protein CcmA [Pseudomonadota bacterium]
MISSANKTNDEGGVKTGNGTALVLANVACERGGLLIFAGLSLTVRAGTAVQITGRNGAGKSSLLRLVAGLLEPSAGHIRFDGIAADETRADHCHYLGHENGLKRQLTVRDNLAFWEAVYGPSGRDPDDALLAVGLERLADLPAGFLSAGQKRRVAIARLLVSQRLLWLLDEPNAALDRQADGILGDLVTAHLRNGGLAIAATHMPLPFPVAETLDLTGLKP